MGTDDREGFYLLIEDKPSYRWSLNKSNFTAATPILRTNNHTDYIGHNASRLISFLSLCVGVKADSNLVLTFGAG